MSVRLMLVALVLAVVAGPVVAQVTYEAESLPAPTVTAGVTEPFNLVETGLAQPGQFGGDRIVFWHDAEQGQTMTFRVPVDRAGSYRIKLALAKSWDYGVMQAAVNGVDLGEPIDLSNQLQFGTVLPLSVTLGPVNLQAGEARVSLRTVAHCPDNTPDFLTYYAGVDAITLTPASVVGPVVGAVTEIVGGGHAGAQMRYEAEALPAPVLTGGTAEPFNLVETALAQPGQFGGNRIVFWHDNEQGNTMTFKVPVGQAGSYRVALDLAKSWDYGIMQPAVNGVDLGGPIDLSNQLQFGTVFPLSVTLGPVNLQAGEAKVSLRAVAHCPDNTPDFLTYYAGIDAITLTPLSVAGPVVGPVGGAVRQQAPDLGNDNAWLDDATGALTVLADDLTWAMARGQGAKPSYRAGTWGAPNMTTMSIRTCLADPSQLWVENMPPSVAAKLTTGQYDLTMVWELHREGAKMVGALRTWRAKWDADGKIIAFKAYNAAGNEPSKVTWSPVLRPAPGQAPPPELERLMKGGEGGVGLPSTGAGAAFKGWASEFIREGDVFGDERGE